MLTPAWTHPAFLWTGAALGLAALALGLWAQARPGFGVRVVGQRPWLQGLGLALLLTGAGVGLAEPRWGTPEVPRLIVHVVLDASRSMRVADTGDGTRWRAAAALLDRLWARPNPGVQFSLDLLTGDAVPVLPPGEDQGLLRDALRAATPGEVGSPGSAYGRGLSQVAALVEPRTPSIVFVVGDGEETWEGQAQAFAHASAALRKGRLPLYACVLGQTTGQPVPADPEPGPGDGSPGAAAGTAAARGTAGAASASRTAATPGRSHAGRGPRSGAAQPGPEPERSAARPDFLRSLAGATGGRLLAAGEDPAPLFQRLAQGSEPLPLARSLLPAHPEWGAWLALAGLCLWLGAAGRPMRAWRPFLLMLLALGQPHPARAGLPRPLAEGPSANGPPSPPAEPRLAFLPDSVRAWRAQAALDAGDLDTARRWKPGGPAPLHLLLAAEIAWREHAFQDVLTTLAPLTGQGAPRPAPPWRAPALLMAARACRALDRLPEARSLLERLLLEQPGRPEAVHNLQALLQDPPPAPPPPRKPPPPPPPKPSQGARQDELDGLRQRLPRKVPPPGGVKDI